jgi:hypothetical protein
MADIYQSLYDAIQRRPRPEDVAQLIIETLDLDTVEKRALEAAARHSLKRSLAGYTSMAQEFIGVVNPAKEVAKAAIIFKVPDPPSAADCMFVDVVESFMRKLGEPILVCPEQSDFKADRLDRAERKAAGLKVTKRQYNKRFRAVRRFKDRIERMIRNGRKYDASRMAKSAGATKVTLEDLRKDLPTACFVAYLSARMSLRSTFTNESQVRAFDNISDTLYKKARKGNPNWWAIALVHPEREVLQHLSEEERGKLLGIWTESLHMIADLLEDTYRENSLDLRNMVVDRGNDSSTWNAAAGAWNKAREHWIKLLFDLGMERVLELYCPGKVLRLMAADVVRWHSYSKGADALHPDTKVWRDLPHPWKVFKGEVPCPRSLVEQVCEHHEVQAQGWAGPTLPKRAVAFTATPELVHGVTVTSPFLARVLKDAGWFSGKEVKEPRIPAEVVRDAAGAVLYVQPAQGVSQDQGSPPPSGPPGTNFLPEPEASV